MAPPAGVAGRRRERVVVAAFDAHSDPLDVLAAWASHAGERPGGEPAIGLGSLLTLRRAAGSTRASPRRSPRLR